MNEFKIVVPREQLLAVVRQNRDSHRAAFEKALGEYREACILELETWLTRARAGKRIRAYTGLVMPEDHTRDYDRVIAMLEMSVSETLELDEERFATYARDEWAWTGQFGKMSTSNKTYVGTMRAQSGDDE